jgi:hypothetical protein
VLPAQCGNLRPLLLARDPARREGSVVHEHHAGSGRHGRREPDEIEPPAAVANLQRDDRGHGAHEAHPVDHARVGRIGQHDLVAGVGEADETVAAKMTA